MDRVTDSVISLLGQNGFTVTIRESPDHVVATATHPTEGEWEATGTGLYKTVCDLARQCGMELDDG